MPRKINRLRVKERAVTMNNAWAEGAPKISFMDIPQEVLANAILQAENLENTSADLRAQLKMIEDKIDDAYVGIDGMIVNVANGVRGDKNYGDDSPLYGAMGFVRKSERKSGLTRKKKKPTEE